MRQTRKNSHRGALRGKMWQMVLGRCELAEELCVLVAAGRPR
jgi:hypothetical protein